MLSSFLFSWCVIVNNLCHILLQSTSLITTKSPVHTPQSSGNQPILPLSTSSPSKNRDYSSIEVFESDGTPFKELNEESKGHRYGNREEFLEVLDF